MTESDQIPHRDYDLALDIVRGVTETYPITTQFNVVGRIANAGVDKAVAADIVDNLVATNRLVRWEGAVHWPGYEFETRTWLTLAKDNRLRRWIEREAESDHPDGELIALLNEKRDSLADQ